MRACEFFQQGDYLSAISNAEKSYESVLKIVCDVQKGNADKLIDIYLDNEVNTLPVTMNSRGFKNSVMMALPFIRNNSAADHGAGNVAVIINRSLAKLAVNLAAALNTYIIEEYKNALATENKKTLDNAPRIDDDGPPF